MYCLDTNIIVALFRGDKKIKDKLALIQKINAEIYTTTLSLCELYKGVYLSNQQEKNLELIKEFLSNIKVLALSNKSSQLFGEDYFSLKKEGKLTSEIDLMISSIVKTNNLILVTRNIKHFKEVSNLKVEGW